MAKNWLTTPQAVDLYNFIKHNILVIFPLNDYDYKWTDIERKILDLRHQHSLSPVSKEELNNALSQLIEEGTLTAYHWYFVSTLSRETGNFN